MFQNNRFGIGYKSQIVRAVRKGNIQLKLLKKRSASSNYIYHYHFIKMTILKGRMQYAFKMTSHRNLLLNGKGALNIKCLRHKQRSSKGSMSLFSFCLVISEIVHFLSLFCPFFPPSLFANACSLVCMSLVVLKVTIFVALRKLNSVQKQLILNYTHPI